MSLDYRYILKIKQQIKLKGQFTLFLKDREFDIKEENTIFFQFPFNISNISLSKNNRKAILVNEEKKARYELRIKRILYPRIIKAGGGVGFKGFDITLEHFKE